VRHCEGCGIEINARIGIIYEHVISAGLGGEPMLDKPGGTLTARRAWRRRQRSMTVRSWKPIVVSPPLERPSAPRTDWRIDGASVPVISAT
jgi:hypothetical protein